MGSDEENLLFTQNPSRKRRRLVIESSSSEDEGCRHSEVQHVQPAVIPEGVTAAELMELLTAIRGRSSKASVNSIPNHQNNVVPEFDPDNRTQSIQRWLKKVDECSEIYGWDEKQTIHFALLKLSGLAKRWYESLSTLSYSWKDWQLKLVKAFPSEINFGKLLEKMLGRTTRSGENLREYFYEKLTLLSRCEINVRKAVDCVIHGITDVAIRNGAQALRCTEPEELLSYLVSQKTKDFLPQSSMQVRRREFRNPNSVNFSRNPTSNISLSSFSSNNMLCFNCHERGHPYTKCSKPITKCRNCGRIGHDSEHCNQKPLLSHNNQNRVSNPERKTLKIVTKFPKLTHIDKTPNSKVPLKVPNLTSVGMSNCNKKFFKAALVNDKAVIAYIDFGSDCSLMRLTDAKELGLIEITTELPIVKGFGNATIKPLFKSKVKLEIDEIQDVLEVLVVDDKFMHTSILVGQNFTERPSVTVLKDSETLFFYCSPSNDSGIDSKMELTIKLYVLNDTEVVKGGLVEVYTEGSYTGNIYTDGNTRTSPGQEYHFHRGCYTLTGGKGVVFVTTLTNTPVIFRANNLPE